ncbi:MAG: MATE family efflux transporter [Lachnospiraceae bacterium]
MSTDLTKGNILTHLISFTIPLILGNLFQLTYNAVDSIIIGRCAGDNALAAVGTSDPVMNLLILGITGLCIGASVLMSNYFGSQEYEKMREEMATMITLGAILSLTVMGIGLFLSHFILTLMRVPDEIMSLALTYLRMIFIGMPFTCLYNIYAAALRSVGDTKTPIRFLAISSVLNGCLDFLFIAIFHFGTFGAALATDFAQIISAVLCVFHVYRHVPLLHLNRRHFIWNKDLIQRTIHYGCTTALQQCSQPIGKLFIQGVVNTLGVSTIAAFNAVGKIEDFALVPERSISNAMMTFTAQNDGANQEKRIHEGLRKGLLLECGYWFFICIFLLLFHRPMLSVFSTERTTMSEGSRYFMIMSFFYWLPALTNGMQGFFRGLGQMKMTLYGTITQISFRVLFTFLLVPYIGIVGVAFACVIGWIAMLLLEIPYCIYLLRKRAKKEQADNF